MVSSHHDDDVIPRLARGCPKLNRITAALNVIPSQPLNHIPLNHLVELPIVSPALCFIVNYSFQSWSQLMQMEEERPLAT